MKIAYDPSEDASKDASKDTSKDTKKMEIEYDPSLVGEIINLEIERRDSENNDNQLFEEYQKMKEPIYDIEDEDDREDAFEEADREFFDKLSMGGGMEEVLEDFPTLQEQIGFLEIRRAVTREEEEGNISNRELETGKKAAIIRFRPDCFMQPEAFKKVIRHECMHLADILNEDFDYNTKRFAPNPSEESFIRDRYRIMWDMYIGSRFEKEGREEEADKSGCYKEFEALYLKVPADQRKAIFEKVWEMENLTHPGILELAKDPYKLLQLTGEAKEEDKGKMVLPGTACPLCKFPSYEIITDISEEAKEKIIEEFPNWDAGWACERCLDLYNLKPMNRAV